MPSHSSENPYLRTTSRSKAPLILALVLAGTLVGGGVAVAFAVGLLGGKQQPAQKETEPVVEPEEKEEAEEEPAQPQTFSLVGVMDAGSTRSVTAEWDGTVQGVSASQGQSVKEGDVVLTISALTGYRQPADPSAERAALESAQAQYKTAEQAHEEAVAARDAAWKDYEQHSGEQAAHDQWEKDMEAYQQAHAQWESDMAAYDEAVEAAQAEADRLFEETGEQQAVDIGVEHPGDEPVAPVEPAVTEKPSDSLDLDVQLAESQLSIAQAALEDAQSAYDEVASQKEEPIYETRQMRAPSTGTVIALNVAEGAYVSRDSSAVLFTVADTSQLVVRVKASAVTDEQLARIEQGQKAKATFSGISGLESEATVSKVSPTEGIELKLQSVDERLKVGTGVTLSFEVKEQSQGDS